MIKCPYCGKEFEQRGQAEVKWYHSDIFVVIAILCLGPLALRLVWTNPRYKPIVKWLITVVIIILTVFVIMMFYNVMQTTARQLEELGLG